MNFVYELPFGKGKQLRVRPERRCKPHPGWLAVQRDYHSQHGSADWSWNSVAISPILELVRSARGRISVGIPTLIIPPSDRWFDKSVFSEPAPFTYGNAGRNIIIGPGNQTWTLGLLQELPDRGTSLRCSSGLSCLMRLTM